MTKKMLVLVSLLLIVVLPVVLIWIFSGRNIEAVRVTSEVFRIYDYSSPDKIVGLSNDLSLKDLAIKTGVVSEIKNMNQAGSVKISGDMVSYKENKACNVFSATTRSDVITKPSQCMSISGSGNSIYSISKGLTTNIPAGDFYVSEGSLLKYSSGAMQTIVPKTYANDIYVSERSVLIGIPSGVDGVFNYSVLNNNKLEPIAITNKNNRVLTSSASIVVTSDEPDTVHISDGKVRSIKHKFSNLSCSTKTHIYSVSIAGSGTQLSIYDIASNNLSTKPVRGLSQDILGIECATDNSSIMVSSNSGMYLIKL